MFRQEPAASGTQRSAKRGLRLNLVDLDSFTTMREKEEIPMPQQSGKGKKSKPEKGAKKKKKKAPAKPE
jgi:hypothetical protein